MLVELADSEDSLIRYILAFDVKSKFVRIV